MIDSCLRTFNSILAGSLNSFGHWAPDSRREARSELTTFLFAEASRAGLKTPHTLISNQPIKAAAFMDTLGETECAIKALNARAVRNGKEYRFPHTTTLPMDGYQIKLGV